MANYYYSGQGSVYAAKRDAATGQPLGFLPLANVPELTIDIEVDKFEHKESETGGRNLDLTIIKEKKGKFKAKMESVPVENLALGVYGHSAKVPLGTIVDEPLKFYAGMRMPLKHISVSAVTVEGPVSATFAVSTVYALGAYVQPITPNGHYYKVTVAGASDASEPVWPTNGATVVSATATFLDMGTIAKVAGVDYTADLKNGTLIFPASGTTLVDGDDLLVSYSHAAYMNLEAFTSAVSPERWLRFEGLNTVDDAAVVVDLYRAQFDPLTGYSLINDEIASLDMSGNLLADPFISGVNVSKFFRQRNAAVTA